ncbi:13299_t:CDS:2 [Acaulospora colombiana]|uniref:13299_t:CDS:1 n=1 Tax=Acaulospora colombiana TaxID=27376 RepID=A0ACA9KZS4_9GLOM|nr:13299_t:CDS:2 [Acaulospora colombiana]
MEFHRNIGNDLTTIDRKRKGSFDDVKEDVKPTPSENFKKRLLDFDYDSDSYGEYEESDAEKVNCLDEGEEILNITNFSFDEWVDTCNSERWTLNNGEKVRDVLLRMTQNAIKKLDKSKRIDGKILSVIRLGLSSIIDLSSEFEEGMHTWFGQDWEDLKAKCSSKIKFEIKRFEGNTLADIIKIEELCTSYKYWEAWSYILDRMKERPSDDAHRQVLRIYFYVGETVSKPTLNRKIDLRVLTVGDDRDLSHSEFARKATPLKIIKDRIEDSTIFGLQSAGLEGQIFAVDLLDEGLYFSLNGPSFRFPAQLNDIRGLRNTLEVLYLFKANIANKAKYLSHNDGNRITKILDTKSIAKKPQHIKVGYIKKTYFTPKESLINEIKTISSQT